MYPCIFVLELSDPIEAAGCTREQLGSCFGPRIVECTTSLLKSFTLKAMTYAYRYSLTEVTVWFASRKLQETRR